MTDESNVLRLHAVEPPIFCDLETTVSHRSHLALLNNRELTNADSMHKLDWQRRSEAVVQGQELRETISFFNLPFDRLFY